MNRHDLPNVEQDLLRKLLRDVSQLLRVMRWVIAHWWASAFLGEHFVHSSRPREDEPGGSASRYAAVHPTMMNTFAGSEMLVVAIYWAGGRWGHEARSL